MSAQRLPGSRCRQARVGWGMIACMSEATSWRSRRQVSGRVRRPEPSPRPSGGELLDAVDERLEQKDDQEMGHHVRLGGVARRRRAAL